MIEIHDIQQYSKKYNISENFFQCITDKNQLTLIIQDINADRDIHVELTQFIYNTDFYVQLENKLSSKRKELAAKDNFKERVVLSEIIVEIEEELKQGMKEVQLHKEGKTELQSARDFLNEL